jgi:hypothetical protein
MTAAQAQSITRYTTPGHPVKLSFYSSTNPDCTSIGWPTIRLTRAPEHGRVSVKHTTDFPTFRTDNIRSACNGRRVPGGAIYYVPERGYLGTDYVDTEVIFASGGMRQNSFTVNVR